LHRRSSENWGSRAISRERIEVLEALRRQEYDLVFMDCQMPEMDGFEATRRIRVDEERTGAPRVRIIAMTANAMKGDRELCLAAGMDDYICKPVAVKELARVLESLAPAQALVAPSSSGVTDVGAAADQEAALLVDRTQVVVDCRGRRGSFS
jgi:CheY-like chemotaxis protein